MYEVTVERTLVIEALDEDTAVNRAIERLNDPGQLPPVETGGLRTAKRD